MKKLIFAILVGLAIVSCSMETGVGTRDGRTVTLTLQTPGSFDMRATRVLTADGECRVDDITVMVFDANNMLVDVVQVYNTAIGADDPQALPAGGNGGGTFQVTLPESTAAGNMKESNLVVLTNIGSTLATTVENNIGKSYAEIVALTTFSVPEAFSGSLPMWGETGHFAVSTAGNDREVELVRALARVDVGVGAASFDGTDEPAWSWDGENADGEIPFKLKSVIIARPATGGMLIDGAIGTNHELTEMDNFTYPVTGGRSITQTVYTPESDILLTGRTGWSDYQKHTSRTAVIVGGVYDNDPNGETFYRLDFTNTAGTALVDILRGHLYQFNISDVWGPGYDDPEEAYNADPQAISYNVLPWEDGKIGGDDMVGQYKFELTPDPVETDSAAKTMTLGLLADHDWEATVAANEDGTGSAPGWLTFGSGAVSKEGSGSAAPQNFPITFTESNEHSPRTAWIIFELGSLTVPVKVTQEGVKTVKIGAYTWAVGNVDTFGTFVDEETQSGKLYQFGSAAMPFASKVAWPGKDDFVDTGATAVSGTNPGMRWANNATVGTFNWPATAWSSDGGWTRANDPCPAGFSVPTMDQLNDLIANSTITKDASFGRKFVDKIEPSNYIYLPAVGSLNNAAGTFAPPIPNVSGSGYASSTANPNNSLQDLYILWNSSDTILTQGYGGTYNGAAIRCVVDEAYDIAFPTVDGGSAIATPAAAEMGETMSVRAIPDPGWAFIGWTSDANLTLTDEQKQANPLTFEMPAADITLTPTFLQMEVDVNGVIWYNANVGRPGTFEEFGVYDDPSNQYTWDEAMTGGTGIDGSVCPAGWRMPTAQEYVDLFKPGVVRTLNGVAPQNEDGDWVVGGNPSYGTSAAFYAKGDGLRALRVGTDNGVVLFPASGYDNGTNFNTVNGNGGYYYNATETYSANNDTGYAQCFMFTNVLRLRISNTKDTHASIRCVRGGEPGYHLAVGDLVWAGQNVSAAAGYFNPTTTYDTSTALYDWEDAKTVACPAGWRLPSAQEYLDLFEKTTALNFADAGLDGTWSLNGAPMYKSNPGWITPPVSAINGTRVVTASGELFFSASGSDWGGGPDTTRSCSYFSSTKQPGNATGVMSLTALEGFVFPAIGDLEDVDCWASVRCVREL